MILSDQRLANLLLEAGFPRDPRVIAEGIGVIHAESGGNPGEASQGSSGHIGLWAEEPGFGSAAERLDPLKSTQAAFRQWKKDGGFWQAWGQWETGETEGTGPSRYKQYLAVAERAIRGAGGRGAAPAKAPGGAPAKPKVSTNGSASSGLMTFLMTAALVLGGTVLVGLGAMRSVGQRRYLEASAA